MDSKPFVKIEECENLPVKVEEPEKEGEFYKIDVTNFMEWENDETQQDPSRQSSDDERKYSNPDSSVQPARRRQQKFNPRPMPGSEHLTYEETCYLCNFCDKKLKPRKSILRHIKNKHDPEFVPYGCRICIERFKTSDDLDEHVNERHSENDEETIIFCDICNISGDNRLGMRNHLTDDHKIDAFHNIHAPTMIPKMPEKSRHDIQFLPRALPGQNHLPYKDIVYSCNFCEKQLKPRKSMLRHMRNKHGNGQGNFVTHRENKFNPRPLPGSEHLTYKEIWYSCNFCDKKLRPKKNILRHMKHKHDPQFVRFGCRFCIERFKTSDDLNEHVNKRHSENDEETTILCDICGVRGDNVIGMEHHMTDYHNVSASYNLQRPSSGITKKQEEKPKHHTKFHPRPLPGQANLPYSDIIYSCNFCDKRLKPRKSLLRHIQLKHDPQFHQFGCRYCLERFVNETKLDEHSIKFHEGAKASIFFCDICGVSGDHKAGMENHMIDDHVNRTPTREIHSNENRLNISEASKRQVDHTGTYHLACDQCDEKFPNAKELRRHVLLVHDKMYRPLEKSELWQEVKCCACGRQFENEPDLNDHLLVHRKDFTFNSCTHSAALPKGFDAFVKHCNYYAKPKTHECLKCFKAFPFGAKFFGHIKDHNRYNRKFSCKKCGKGFRSSREAEIHDRWKHQNQTLFICPICAKSVSSRAVLDSHIKYVHNKTQENKHECKICSAKFAHISKLRRHETTHKTDRPHVCELCGSAFKTPEGLFVHMKRHNGTLVKKYSCNQCNVKTTTKDRLQLHFLTHAGIVSFRFELNHL